MAGSDTWQEAVTMSFRNFDSDGDGYISLQELHDVLVAIGTGNDVEVASLLDSFKFGADSDHDGRVTYEEFLEWLARSHEDSDRSAWDQFQFSTYAERRQVYNHGVEIFKVQPDGSLSQNECAVRRLLAKSETHYGGDTKPTVLLAGPWKMQLKVIQKEGEIRIGIISRSAYMAAVDGTTAGCSWYRHECADAGLFFVAYAHGAKLYHGRSRVENFQDVSVSQGDTLAFEYKANQLSIAWNGNSILEAVDVSNYVKAHVPGDLVFGVQFHHTEDAVDILDSIIPELGGSHGWAIAYKSQLDADCSDEGIELTVPSDYRKGDAKPTILFGMKHWFSELQASVDCNTNQCLDGVPHGTVLGELSFKVRRKTKEMRVGLVAFRNFSQFGDRGGIYSEGYGGSYGTCVAGYSEVAEITGVPGLSWYKDDCGNGTASYCVAYSGRCGFFQGNSHQGTAHGVALQEGDIFKIQVTSCSGDGVSADMATPGDFYYDSGPPTGIALLFFQNDVLVNKDVQLVPKVMQHKGKGDEEMMQARYLGNLCIGLQLYAVDDSVIVLPAPDLTHLRDLGNLVNAASNEQAETNEAVGAQAETNEAVGAQAETNEAVGAQAETNEAVRTDGWIDRSSRRRERLDVLPPLVADASLSRELELPQAGFSLRPIRQDGPTNDKELFAGLAALFQVEKASDLAKGRDVRESGDYNGLLPARMWQVQSFLNCNYTMARQWMQWKSKNRSDLNIKEETNNLSKYYESIPLSRDRSINEAFLLHGTRPDTVLPILANGLNERFSGGMWGQGTYLGENCEKIDQYCTMDDGKDTAVHEHLFSEHCTNPGSLYYAFVCRVILGQSVHTKNGSESLDGGKVYARTDVATAGRELASIPDSSPPEHHHSLVVELGAKVFRHREFVVFHSDLILPEFLVAYHRTKDGEIVTD